MFGVTMLHYPLPNRHARGCPKNMLRVLAQRMLNQHYDAGEIDRAVGAADKTLVCTCSVSTSPKSVGADT